MHGFGANEISVPVDTPEISEIKIGLGFAGRVAWIIRIVGPDSNHIVSPCQVSAYFRCEGQVTSKMPGHFIAIDPDGAFPHDGLEVNEKLLPAAPGGDLEAFAIPGQTLVIAATTGIFAQNLQAVRQIGRLPVGIVEAGSFRSGSVSFE